jgi:hypothetical protein
LALARLSAIGTVKLDTVLYAVEYERCLAAVVASVKLSPMLPCHLIFSQLIAASTDTEESHLAWIRTPRHRGGLGHMQIPVMADTTKEIAAR